PARRSAVRFFGRDRIVASSDLAPSSDSTADGGGRPTRGASSAGRPHRIPGEPTAGCQGRWQLMTAGAGDSMFGSVTNRDRLMWQSAAATVLAALLREAADAGMPFVSWALGTGCTIVAKCLMGDSRQRRADFHAWSAFFGIADWREWGAAED